MPQFPVHQIITQRYKPSHPYTFLLGSGDLVTDTFPYDLTLKLRKGEQHIERKSAHGRSGIKLLRDGYEGYAVFIKYLYHLGKIVQGA